jgi:hypothetical protein
MHTSHGEPFFTALVATPQVQDMWNIRNGGVPVFVHTVDVTMLALDSFGEWQDRNGPMDLVATLVGALLHDLTKVSARATRGQLTHRSHSEIMLFEPLAAVAEAHAALDVARDVTGIVLSQAECRSVEHIIASHHGPWGSVQPRTPEAALVHYCDLYSARYHRQPPIDANDILHLMDGGLSRAAAARALGVTSQVVAKRLDEARRAEWLDDNDELLAAWRRRGHVVAGSDEAVLNREEIRLRSAQAQEAPRPFFAHPTWQQWRSAPGG